MHAVVVRSTVHDIEKGRTFLQEQAIPRISQAPGFVGGTWIKLEGDAGTSTLVFESEDQARSAIEELRTNPPPADAVTINSAEVGEVVARV